MAEPTSKVLVFEELTTELRTGPFSILSEKALDRLVTMIRLAMEDGFKRGEEAGKQATLLLYGTEEQKRLIRNRK